MVTLLFLLINWWENIFTIPYSELTKWSFACVFVFIHHQQPLGLLWCLFHLFADVWVGTHSQAHIHTGAGTAFEIGSHVSGHLIGTHNTFSHLLKGPCGVWSTANKYCSSTVVLMQASGRGDSQDRPFRKINIFSQDSWWPRPGAYRFLHEKNITGNQRTIISKYHDWKMDLVYPQFCHNCSNLVWNRVLFIEHKADLTGHLLLDIWQHLDTQAHGTFAFYTSFFCLPERLYHQHICIMIGMYSNKEQYRHSTIII